MAKRKNYSGSDLDSSWKSWVRKEMKRIEKILVEKGCTQVELNFGFYYFSGFFTSESGQVYYISCSDTRTGYENIMYRTAKDYSDFSGGSNQWIKKENLNNIRLS